MPRLDAHGADGDGNAERFGRLCRKRPARLLDVSARAGDISRCAAKERKKEERDDACRKSHTSLFHRLFLLVLHLSDCMEYADTRPQKRLFCLRSTFLPAPLQPLHPFPPS